MTAKPLSIAIPAALAALCLVPSAEARPRLLPGPLAGTAMVLGGLAAGGVGLAILKARACKADPACTDGRPRGIAGTAPPAGPATVPR
jgi:hypothetical protein